MPQEEQFPPRTWRGASRWWSAAGASSAPLFLANDTAVEQTVTASGHDLVSDRPVGPVVLRPGAVAVREEA